MNEREERGLKIAALCKIEQNPLGWKVPSQSGNGSYVVKAGEQPFCTCPDFEARQLPCKHVYAVQYVLQRETKADGSTHYKESVQVTQTNEWTTYNIAQTHEQERFVELLQDLCAGIVQPEQSRGRPRLPLSDVVFSAVLKTYSTMSGRRFISALKDAQGQGLTTKAPHYNSTFTT